ncbi:MAG: hypothetical protein MUF42_11540 [Cytophagaceae bacterium]|jgi:hypothetical protein|nr:hypothetical protein [Cytophagaceae bacterium]
MKVTFWKCCWSGILFSLLLSCNKNEPKPAKDNGRFIKFFGSAKNSRAYALEELPDGFVLCGYTIQDSPGGIKTDKDIRIVKTDKIGNRIWEKILDSGYDEVANSLKVVGSSIVITGSQKDSTGRYHAFFMELNSNGEVLGQRNFSTTGFDVEGFYITQLSDGDYLLGGVKSKSDSKKMTLIRFTSDSIKWEQNVGNLESEDQLSRVIELSNTDLLWTGTTQSGGSKNCKVVLTDRNGNQKWAYDYDLNSIDETSRYIAPTSDGSFVIIGSRGLEGSTNERLYIAKINSNGLKTWETLPISVQSGGYSIQAARDGGYIVAGYKFKSTGNTDILLLRINDEGQIIWEKTFGGSRFDQGRVAMECSDGYFAIAGYADLFDNQNNVFAFIKVDASGNVNE